MISAGTRLGPYEVVSRIGAGGMGEVFKARDTRLDRSVAIKVLPAELTHNAQLRVRFEREAKTISQLTHPHICTLYDIGNENGVSFLVMELLDGETLADRISRGPLPLHEVLRYGAQIAEALGKAHKHGVVHRDLKPGNIMVTKSGAKLLDFGLAKAAQPAVNAEGATVQKSITEQGTILGTFQYMAPEQLEGLEADARTDIFAFGALLYEMATGRRAFEGKTRTSLIAAIVSAQPQPISQIQPLTPPALEHVVSKCLEKDPEDRWQSAQDIAEELRWISDAGSQAGVAAPLVAKKRSRERIAWVLSALFAMSLAAAAIYMAKNRRPEMTYSFTIPSATTTSYIGGNPAAISPDGTMFAFTARKDPSTPRQMWLRSVASFEARPLAGTENAANPGWSSDSRWILFNADGKLKRISVDGGAAEVIVDRASNAGAAMNAAGTILFAQAEGGLYRLPKGGTAQQITTPERSRYELTHNSPHFLPDEKHFLFVALARDAKQKLRKLYLYAGNVDSRKVEFLGEIPSFVRYSEPGYLLFVRDGSLVARPFNARNLEFTGEPVTLVENVYYFKPAGFAGFSASRNGIVTYSTPVAASSLAWIDLTGKAVGPPIRTNESFGEMRIARDGTRVTVAIKDVKIGTTDIWSLGLTRSTATRLTFDDGWEDNAVITPDGKQMFYASDRIGVPDIFVKQIGSAEEDRTVLVDEGDQRPADISPDGRYLIYTSDRFDATRSDIWIMRPDGSEKPRPFVRTPFREFSPRISPDGKWLAYVSDESGKNQVYVKPFPDVGEARQISTVTGTHPRWSPDSRYLYFREWDKVMAADMKSPDAEPQFLFETEREIGSIEVAPDGKRFLVELTDRRDTQQPTRVIVNWPAMIETKRKSSAP